MIWFLVFCLTGAMANSAYLAWRLREMSEYARGERLRAEALSKKVFEAEMKLAKAEMIPDDARGEGIKGASGDYSVTGLPTRVPWHIRRKELEAQARSKRKAYEELREA